MSGSKFSNIYWGVLLALLVGALAMLTAPAGAAVDGRAARMTPTSTPPTAGNRLFYDDFRTYSNRWQTQNSAKMVVEVLDGTLRMRIVSPGVRAWSAPDFDVPLRDYDLSVTAAFYAGTPDSVFGLVLDYRDESNFYAWGLSVEGKWSFGQQRDGKWLDLTPPDSRPVPLLTDQHTFTLRAEVRGAEVSFYVDTHLAGVVKVEPERSGEQFGVFARAGKGYVDVAFDDVTVVDHARTGQP